jgi:hypothetical protein
MDIVKITEVWSKVAVVAHASAPVERPNITEAVVQKKTDQIIVLRHDEHVSRRCWSSACLNRMRVEADRGSSREQGRNRTFVIY